MYESCSGESATTCGRERNVHIYFFYSRLRFLSFISFLLSLSLSFREFSFSPSRRLSYPDALFRSFLRSPPPDSALHLGCHSRSGILKPPCRNKAGLWATRALLPSLASQKYNVSAVCLTLLSLPIFPPAYTHPSISRL